MKQEKTPTHAVQKKTVAVVGASDDRRKFSNKAVRAYRAQGWDVYPVNPKGGSIEGLNVYASLDQIPVRLDRITLYLPPERGLQILPAVAASAATAEFFVNPGAESEKLLSEAADLGLNPILACSIVDIGVRPSALPDS